MDGAGSDGASVMMIVKELTMFRRSDKLGIALTVIRLVSKLEDNI